MENRDRVSDVLLKQVIGCSVPGEALFKHG